MILITPDLTVSHTQDSQDIPLGTCKLAPSVYAWLHNQVANAQSQFRAGTLPSETWETVRTRFNEIHRLALSTYGQANLDKVLDLFSRIPDSERCKINPFGHAKHDAGFQSDASDVPTKAGFQTDCSLSVPQTQSMTIEEIKAILADWNRHVQNFKALNVDIEMTTAHCGKVTIVPELSPNPPPGRNELLVDDTRELLLIQSIFGPGVEIVEYRNKQAVAEEGAQGLPSRESAQ